MTNLERAEKIVRKLQSGCSPSCESPEDEQPDFDYEAWVTAQLDEAVREGLTPELVQTILDKGRNEALNDYKIKECHFKEGFTAAREQALEKCESGSRCGCAERIRAMDQSDADKQREGLRNPNRSSGEADK